MDRQTFTLGWLSLSALVLFVGVLILGALQTPRVQASDMLSTAGSFTMLTGALSHSNDLVYVIDTKSEKLLVYRLNETNRNLELTDMIPLDDPPTPDAKRPKRKP